jgi:O-6-methylguanine DNA methyltransferase
MGFWNLLEAQGWPLLHLAATQRGICGVQFTEETGRFLLDQAKRTGEEEWERGGSDLLEVCAQQLREYFEGRRRRFALTLDLRGTEFQKAIWGALQRIPFGETRSYGEVAEAAGSPGAVRAAGAACGANPVAIVAPCHRVVTRGGGLGGYAGGLELKRRLLELEARAAKGVMEKA